MNHYSNTAALASYPSAAQMAASPFVIVNAAGQAVGNARTLAVGRALIKADVRGNACRAYGPDAQVLSRKQYDARR